LIIFETEAAQSIEESKVFKSKLTAVNENINKIQKRFALGDIDREVYEATIDDFKKEKIALEQELEKLQFYLSNPSDQIKRLVEKVANLKNLWISSSVADKVKLQKAMFPEGILYDRKNDHYRTTEVNDAVKLISSISNTFVGIKKKDQ
jgi:site-specific DNA recombinase